MCDLLLFSRHAKCFLTSSHDANISFGIVVPWSHRKKIIQRHRLYLKIQDGGRRPSWKPYTIHRQGTICRRNYYNTCFPANVRSLNSFMTLMLQFGYNKMSNSGEKTHKCKFVIKTTIFIETIIKNIF